MSFGKENGSSKSTSNSTSNSTSTPNNLASLQTGWNLADQLLQGTSGNSVANTNAGLDLTRTGATNGANAANTGLTTATGLSTGGAVNDANQYLTPFANGSMTGNNNPYFADMVGQLSRALQPQVDGAFAAEGRYGSGANANAFNTALTNEAGQLGYNNYNDSLNRQTEAAGQLSANNSNSTNAALTALGVIPSLSGATTNAGLSLSNAGATPLNNYANILSLLGSGGGTASNIASGSQTGKTSSSSSNFDLLSPLKDGKNIFEMTGL